MHSMHGNANCRTSPAGTDTRNNDNMSADKPVDADDEVVAAHSAGDDVAGTGGGSSALAGVRGMNDAAVESSLPVMSTSGVCSNNPPPGRFSPRRKSNVGSVCDDADDIANDGDVAR